MNLLTKKVLKLMPDYDCYPLWISDRDGLDNVDPDAFEIPNELKISLHSWSNTYDKTLNLEDPFSSGFPNRESKENFDLRGKKLWHELKKYLGDKYLVVYYSAKDTHLYEGETNYVMDNYEPDTKLS